MLELHVCIGSSCHLRGSYSIIQTFQQMIGEEALQEAVGMKAQFCMKQCQNGVCVSVGGEKFSVSPETARGFFRAEVLPRVKQGG